MKYSDDLAWRVKSDNGRKWTLGPVRNRAIFLLHILRELYPEQKFRLYRVGTPREIKRYILDKLKAFEWRDPLRRGRLG